MCVCVYVLGLPFLLVLGEYFAFGVVADDLDVDEAAEIEAFGAEHGHLARWVVGGFARRCAVVCSILCRATGGVKWAEREHPSRGCQCQERRRTRLPFREHPTMSKVQARPRVIVLLERTTNSVNFAIKSSITRTDWLRLRGKLIVSLLKLGEL